MYPHFFKIKTFRGVSFAIHKPIVKPCGLVILLPGHLDSKDYNHLVSLAGDLVNSGYTVARIDPSGTWDSAYSKSEYSITQILNDTREVLDEVYLDRTFKNIIMVGHSLGGMLSLLYAARDARISAVVAIMPPYAFVRPNNKEEKDEKSQWAKDGFKTSKRDMPGKSNEFREFKLPYSVVVDSMGYNVLDEVPKLHIPVLLIAGELDDVIPPVDVGLIFNKANEPKEFIVLKGIDHDYRLKEEDIKKVNCEVLKFILKLS